MLKIEALTLLYSSLPSNTYQYNLNTPPFFYFLNIAPSNYRVLKP